MAMTASQARAELFPLIQQVNDDQEHVVITSKSGNAVLVSESEYESMMETIHLVSDPEAWLSIQRGIRDIQQGRVGKPLDLKKARQELEQSKVAAKPHRKKSKARKAISRSRKPLKRTVK